MKHVQRGIVSLPMYDLPEIREHTEAWRDALISRLNAAGLEAGAPDPHDPRGRPLLTQVCGYKLIDGTMPWVQPLATPDYAVDASPGTDYRSVIVVREDDSATSVAHLRGRVAAVNSWDSHSGMNALRQAVAWLASDGRFFAEVKLSGAHRDSIAMIRAGEADTAAIDCLTFALLRVNAPAEVKGVRVLALTKPAPAPPYVTVSDADGDTVEILRRVLATTPPPPELMIGRIEILPRSAYDRIAEIEQAAIDRGYPELR